MHQRCTVQFVCNFTVVIKDPFVDQSGLKLILHSDDVRIV